MATTKKSTDDRVERYTKNGTKVQVSQEQADRLRGLSSSAPSAPATK